MANTTKTLTTINHYPWLTGKSVHVCVLSAEKFNTNMSSMEKCSSAIGGCFVCGLYCYMVKHHLQSCSPTVTGWLMLWSTTNKNVQIPGLVLCVLCLYLFIPLNKCSCLCVIKAWKSAHRALQTLQQNSHNGNYIFP